MMSAVLYSCWNMFEIIMGITNAIMDRKIIPSVKLIAVFIKVIILVTKDGQTGPKVRKDDFETLRIFVIHTVTLHRFRASKRSLAFTASKLA